MGEKDWLGGKTKDTQSSVMGVKKKKKHRHTHGVSVEMKLSGFIFPGKKERVFLLSVRRLPC